jgi:hypothetical protein
MAVTTLTGKFIPEIFDNYVSQKMLENDAFIQSGAAVAVPQARTFLQGPGQSINLPFWKQLVDEAANVSTDDSTSSSTPKAVTSGKQIAIRQVLNQSWSAMNLVATYTGSDPIMHVADNVVDYWKARRQARIIASLDGILADNEANDSGDMVNDIAKTTGTPADSNKFSAEAFIDAQATMSDKLGQLAILIVHRVVYTRMQKLNLIDTIVDSDGKTLISVYQGARVLVDNGCTASGTPTVYTSYLLGTGSLAVDQIDDSVPSELDRTPASGDGGGQETFYSRQQMLIHPFGFQFLTTSITDETPTIAELQAAAQWDRAFERTRIPIAYLQTNG